MSCLAHATWNLLARRKRGELVFFRRYLLVAVPIGLAFVAAGRQFSGPFSPKVWVLCVTSGVVCGCYYRFLGLAYRSTDFTVVYPVARALPVLMVAAIDVFRGTQPSATGWAGMLLVVGGCILAPQQSYGTFSWKRYGTRAIMWVALTAATIVGFTFLDKLAAEIVRQGPGSAAVYCGVWHICACATYLAMQAAFDRRSEHTDQVGWVLPALAALLGFVSYTLVLWAFQLTPHTGYLIAFRQFSIVIGVAAAFIIYREKGASVRLPATGAVMAGLVLIALHG